MLELGADAFERAGERLADFVRARPEMSADQAKVAEQQAAGEARGLVCLSIAQRIAQRCDPGEQQIELRLVHLRRGVRASLLKPETLEQRRQIVNGEEAIGHFVVIIVVLAT